MPSSGKSKNTSKQADKADHAAVGGEHHGIPYKEAARRTWATVRKDDSGGKKPDGSGRF